MQIRQMQKKTQKTDELKVGDLIIYKPTSVIILQLGIIVKAKKLLKLYDILLQTQNIYLRDVPIQDLEKIV